MLDAEGGATTLGLRSCAPGTLAPCRVENGGPAGICPPPEGLPGLLLRWPRRAGVPEATHGDAAALSGPGTEVQGGSNEPGLRLPHALQLWPNGLTSLCPSFLIRKIRMMALECSEDSAS